MAHGNITDVPSIGYYTALDPAYLQDRAALVVLSEPVWVPREELEAETEGWAWRWNLPEPGWVLPKKLTMRQFFEVARRNNAYCGARPPFPPLMIEEIAVFPPKTKRKKVVDTAARMARRYSRVAPTVLVVDRGGSGINYLEDLLEVGQHAVGILAHRGENFTPDRFGYRVPRTTLLETAKGYIERQRVKVLRSQTEGLALLEELRNLDPRPSTGGPDGYRSKAQDDRASALAAALWYRHKVCWRRDAGHAGNWSGPDAAIRTVYPKTIRLG